MQPNSHHEPLSMFLRRYKLLAAVAAALLLTTLVLSFAAFGADCADVRRDTLRLHIRANSDTAADQADKLAVRDAVLAAFGTQLSAAKNKPQAMSQVQDALPAITVLAQKTLQARGCQAAVNVSLVNMYFPTIRYDGFTLPAGNYDALRIDIGAGAGHNWFCVMYPPLCLSAASENTFCLYTEEEQRTVTADISLRFAAVDWWQRTVQKRGNSLSPQGKK